MEADMLSLLGESEYEGETYADVLLQIPEAFAEKVSAFRILPGNRAAWYEGLLPEVMFCQEFIILGQNIFLPVPIVTEGRNCVPSKPDRHLKMTLTPLAAKREALIFKDDDSEKE